MAAGLDGLLIQPGMVTILSLQIQGYEHLRSLRPALPGTQEHWRPALAQQRPVRGGVGEGFAFVDRFHHQVHGAPFCGIAGPAGEGLGPYRISLGLYALGLGFCHLLGEPGLSGLGERAPQGGLITHIKAAVHDRLVVDKGLQLKLRRSFPRGRLGLPEGQSPLKGDLIVFGLIHHNEGVFQGFHQAVSSARGLSAQCSEARRRGLGRGLRQSKRKRATLPP